jgi:hypothetical protein
MAEEDGEQASPRGSGPGPRPVATLREGLDAEAGFAMRRGPPAATEPEPDGLGPAAHSESNGTLHEPAPTPQGPDYAVMRTVIAAATEAARKARVRWRMANLDLPDDPEARDGLLNAEGRLKVASPETRKSYLDRGRAMLARYKHETGIQVSLEDMDPRQFANWLLGLKPFLKKDTWRGYRASAAAIIRSIPSEHMDEALGMLQANLQVGSDEGYPAFTNKDKVDKKGEDDENDENGEEEGAGASPRAKRMEYQHYQHLRRSLRVMSRGQTVEWLLDWLDADINTGLRPMEWALTWLERRRFKHGECIWLHVVSAKAADGRGTYRTLDISEFTADTVGAVERTVERSRDWVITGRSSQRQGEVSRLFRQTCRELFPRMTKHYTLYSLRHQFIANMKTIYSREELAAMVGQISTETQVDHYGKRRASWTRAQIPEVPKPVREQVAQTKKQLELLDSRFAVKAMKEARRSRRRAVEIDP